MQQRSDDMQQLNARVTRVEGDVERIKTAFVPNDRGVEDYDGHRKEHAANAEEEKAMSELKIGATKKIVMGLIGLVITLIGFGIGPYVRSLLGVAP